MANLNLAFIQQNFTTVQVLKDGAQGRTELVLGRDNNTYVRKRIPLTGLPYAQLQGVRSPYLPVIFYVTEDEGATWVVEEHVNGVNLRDTLTESGPLPETDVLQIGLALADALVLLHGMGILHRDIKPSNIVRQPTGNVRLIDFGAARQFSADAEDRTQDTHIIYTQGYAAPEQYGFGPTDARSDVYSLGVTLRELLGASYAGALSHVLLRYQSAQELKDALEELLPPRTYTGFEKVHAYFGGTGEKTLEDRHKNVLLILLAAVLVVVGGLWQAGQQGTAPAQPAKQQQGVTDTQTEKKLDRNQASPQQAAGRGRGAQKPEQAAETAQPKATTPNAEQSAQNAPKAADASTQQAPAPSTPQANEHNFQQASAPSTSQPSAPAKQFPTPDAAGFVNGARASLSLQGLSLTRAVHPSMQEPAGSGRTAYAVTDGANPVVLVTNTGTKPLINPRVDLYFSGLVVHGFVHVPTETGWGRMEWELCGGGTTKPTDHMTIRVSGQLFQGETMRMYPGVRYARPDGAAAPAHVRLVLQADNLPPQELTCAVPMHDNP